MHLHLKRIWGLLFISLLNVAVIMAVSVSVNMLSPSESVKITRAPQGSPHKGLYSALIFPPFLKAEGLRGGNVFYTPC